MFRSTTSGRALAVLLFALALVVTAAPVALAKPGNGNGGGNGNGNGNGNSSPTPTASATASATPTRTPSPSPSAPSTASPTPTRTPSASPSASASPSPPAAPTATASVSPTTRLPGIDVSNWQGTIDWAAVGGAGKRFAIAKATEGQTFNDVSYLRNKRGAAANGIHFTGYHFAQPDRTLNDAIIEADHFVDVAQLSSGNLIPALDLEVHNGLSATELKTWVRTWLDRVSARLGVKPMIYTSPSFWQTYMGNATGFALAGYKVLWVAHWGTTAPTVPAQNWGGNGWTFWQYSDCGRVAGIVGCVDLDWYNGTDFAKVRIP